MSADDLRRALTGAGRDDRVVFELFETLLIVRTREGTDVAQVQQFAPDLWTAYGRAKPKGGFHVHADGATVGDALRALLALGGDVLDPPRDPIATLREDVLRAIDRVAREGKLESFGDGEALRWLTVLAADDWKEAHRAYRVALDALAKTLGPPERQTTTKRRGGATLRGAVWATTALFESDHDPGAGALVQIAVWERGAPGALPPWG